MRVFVSSTVFDLIDIRAEVEALLRYQNVAPVMSDEKLSYFDSTFDANSIETCLLNVDNSDAVIVILDQRYGPKLGGYGFENVSATHLEYRRAKTLSKPIYFYVRDRLEADYNIWRRNDEKQNVQLSWAKDCDLLKFLKEHRQLDASANRNNWISLFTNSTDLIESIRRHFDPLIKPQLLMDYLQRNLFPVFTCSMNAELIQMENVPSVQCQICLTNVGQSPAFNFVTTWEIEESESETTVIVSPGQSLNLSLLRNLRFGNEIDTALRIEYDSAIGVTVREKHRVYCSVQGGVAASMISGTTLLTRTYHHGETPQIMIQDA